MRADRDRDPRLDDPLADPATARLIEMGATLTRRLLKLEIRHPPTLSRLARILVRLRALFTARDGLPDWRGQTMAYRRSVGVMYELADAGEPETRRALQSALRYHVGIELRRMVPTEQLAAKGLLPVTPRERTQAHRQAIWMAAQRWQQLGDGVRDGDAVTRLRVIADLLAGISVESIDAGDVEGFAVLLGDIAERLDVLGRAVAEASAGWRRASA